MIRKGVNLLCAAGFVFSIFCFISCTQRMAKQEEQANDQVENLVESEEGDMGEDRLQNREGLTTIYFSFDDYSLNEKSKKALTENYAWLAKNPQKMITIEGHCDERGTAEYNIALGERRANSAKKYLIGLGVNPNQISTISYGEESPADSGQDEDAWTKNRRAEFIIKK